MRIKSLEALIDRFPRRRDMLTIFGKAKIPYSDPLTHMLRPDTVSSTVCMDVARCQP